MRVLFAVNAFWVTLSGRVATVFTVVCLAEGLRVQVLCGCSEHHLFCVYCGELPCEPVPCAQMMDLCKALGEMHVNLEDLPLKQYRARDELPLMQQWARGRADDRATLPADLETMDFLTTATSQPTLRAVEPWRLRNVFENFFDARRSQLIRSAEIALPIFTSWDLLVVDKPADARSRSDKSTEQMLANTTRPCPRCFVFLRRAGRCMHMKCDNPRCQHEFCCLCLHDWTSAMYNASFCIGSAEALAFGGSGACGEADMLQLGATSARRATSGGYFCGGGTSALPRDTHHTS